MLFITQIFKFNYKHYSSFIYLFAHTCMSLKGGMKIILRSVIGHAMIPLYENRNTISVFVNSWSSIL